MAIAADSIGQLITRTVVMAEMEDTVRVALQRMVAEDIGSVVVTDDEKPVGIFTERTSHVPFCATYPSLNARLGKSCLLSW